jgi:aryl-alcohol dehydrogenase-like predicted oxidoreductase
MKKRMLGKTGVMVSEISLGAWQLGGKWGSPFDPVVASETLEAAIRNGINCIDTADVYQGGQSEHAIGKFISKLDDKPFVITKIGRKLPVQDKALYTEEAIRGYVDDSRANMNVKSLDLVLLHCPPTDLYKETLTFDVLDALKKEGKIKNYGVSVQTVEEAMLSLEHPGVAAIEIIFNMFRLKPIEVFFKKAKEKNVGVIVRVPLASGLLTGTYHEKTSFNKDDHRTFNRQGEVFDKGETFSGVDYHLGLQAVDALKKVFKTDRLATFALRWILMFDAVSTIIPGASKPEQVLENIKAADLKPLTPSEMKAVEDIYTLYIKKNVHHLW